MGAGWNDFGAGWSGGVLRLGQPRSVQAAHNSGNASTGQHKFLERVVRHDENKMIHTVQFFLLSWKAFGRSRFTFIRGKRQCRVTRQHVFRIYSNKNIVGILG